MTEEPFPAWVPEPERAAARDLATSDAEAQLAVLLQRPP